MTAALESNDNPTPTAVVVRLVVATAVVTAVAGGVAFAIGGDWRAGWLASAAIAWVGVIISAPLLVNVLRQPVTQAMPMFLVVGMVRAGVFVVGLFVAMSALEMPRVPVIVLSLLFYGVVVVVETSTGMRYFRNASTPPAP